MSLAQGSSSYYRIEERNGVRKSEDSSANLCAPSSCLGAWAHLPRSRTPMTCNTIIWEKNKMQGPTEPSLGLRGNFLFSLCNLTIASSKPPPWGPVTRGLHPVLWEPPSDLGPHFPLPPFVNTLICHVHC
jgi:hypothetical protein